MKEFDKLLKKWKSAKKYCEGVGFKRSAANCDHFIEGVEAARSLYEKRLNLENSTGACTCPHGSIETCSDYYKNGNCCCDERR